MQALVVFVFGGVLAPAAPSGVRVPVERAEGAPAELVEAQPVAPEMQDGVPTDDLTPGPDPIDGGVCPPEAPLSCGSYCCSNSYPYCCGNNTCGADSSCGGGGGGSDSPTPVPNYRKESLHPKPCMNN